MKKLGISILLAACALTASVAGQAAQAEAKDPQSQTGAITSPVPGSVAAHLKATYVRVILPHSAAPALIEHYTKDLRGRVAYDFQWPAIGARIVGLTSAYGNISAQFTDRPESFDQWRRDTRIMYEVDDVSAVLKAAEQAGLKVVQNLNQTPVAWQGRFELAPGFVVEVIKWLPGKP